MLTILSGCVPLASPSDRIDPGMDAYTSSDAHVDALLPGVDAVPLVTSDAPVASPDAPSDDASGTNDVSGATDASGASDAAGATSGDLRSSSGFVEVFYMGEWRPVCDDGFDMQAANVACRQLGYSSATSYMRVEGSSSTFWLDDLMCDGTELRLADCRHPGWGIENCSSYECVQVVCS